MMKDDFALRHIPPRIMLPAISCAHQSVIQLYPHSSSLHPSSAMRIAFVQMLTH